MDNHDHETDAEPSTDKALAERRGEGVPGSAADHGSETGHLADVRTLPVSTPGRGPTFGGVTGSTGDHESSVLKIGAAVPPSGTPVNSGEDDGYASIAG